MITEDYVSFEIAKLLKEKGFDENCNMAFFNETLVDYTMFGFCTGGDLLYCPTLQMAMKWLREKHNLCIEPYCTGRGYLCVISKLPSGGGIYSQKYEGDDESSGQFTTFEKACEAAIKYSLKNLI